MRKIVSLFVLSILFLALKKDEPVSKINGAFQRKEYRFGNMKNWESDKLRKVLKIFSNGYWMVFFYDDHRPGRKIFDGAGGGTYQLKDGKYIENGDFYPWDPSSVGGQTYLKYTIKKGGFQQFGKMNSEKYPNYEVNENFERIFADEPLKNKALEGVWEMTEGTWGGVNKFGEGKYKKHYCENDFSISRNDSCLFFKIRKKFRRCRFV